MRFAHALLAAGAPLASARFFQQIEPDNIVLDPYEKFLIETAPGETQWVTEDEKWELRRVSLVARCSPFPGAVLPRPPAVASF